MNIFCEVELFLVRSSQYLKASETSRPRLEEMRTAFQEQLQQALVQQAHIYESWPKYKAANAFDILTEKSKNTDNPSGYEHAHNQAAFEDMLEFQVYYYTQAIANLSDTPISRERDSMSSCSLM